MRQTVWIARHGNRLDFVYPEWFNTAERRYDPPLYKDGIIQAQKLGHRLKTENITHIFTSPFLRTIQTANEVSQILDLPIKIEAGLSEWFNADWMSETPETQPLQKLMIQYPRIDNSYSSQIIPQYPESELQVYFRCREITQKLVKKYTEDILIIGHSISVTNIAIALIEEDIVINTPLCGLVKVIHNGHKWELKINGDTSHLI